MAEEEGKKGGGEKPKTRRERMYKHPSSVARRVEGEKKTGDEKKDDKGDHGPAPAKGAKPVNAETIGATHATELEELHKRQETERRDLHGTHRDEHRRMHTRHMTELEEVRHEEANARPKAA